MYVQVHVLTLEAYRGWHAVSVCGVEQSQYCDCLQQMCVCVGMGVQAVGGWRGWLEPGNPFFWQMDLPAAASCKMSTHTVWLPDPESSSTPDSLSQCWLTYLPLSEMRELPL